MALFATSNFYLFLKELTHKSWPNKKLVESINFGKKIGNVKNKGTLGEWDPKKYEIEDFLTAYIKFENGSVINLETSFALNIKEKATIMNVELFGTKGGMDLSAMEIYTDYNDELVDIVKLKIKEEDKQENSIRDFLDACNGKVDALITNARQGYEIQRLVEALYESAETGEVIKL